MKSIFGVKNLTASELLSSTVMTVKLASDEVRDRTEGIIFFRFNFNIEPASQDICIFKDPLCFQFSLGLPQQHYNDTTNMLYDISLPAKRTQSSPKKVTGMTYIIGYGGANLFHTQVRNGTYGAGHGTSSNSIGTPVPPGAQKK